MARTVLAVQQVTINGAAPTFAAADQANGMEFANNGDVILEVKNTSASPVTVTLTTPITVEGIALTDPAISVPATTGDRIFGTFSPQVFNQAGGTVYVDFSASSGVTIAAYKLR